MVINQIINCNCIDGLKNLPDDSIHCCVTSPPYFGLRDYGVDGQIGLEETPELFVQNLVNVFNEVRRVLRPDGTLWLNLGDSYAGSGMGSATVKGRGGNKYGLKQKDLIGIPWMVAFALRSAGWYLRQDIIWAKPNPMPESVTDRCTKSHEYIFLLSKSARYFFDNEAIKQPIADSSADRLDQDIENQEGSDRVPGKKNGKMKAVGKRKGYEHRGPYDKKLKSHSGNFDDDGNLIGGGMANKRSVWTVTTRPFKEAHFATFPERLIVDCIKAGCPEGHGIVLDPFMGSGTTALVARKLNRKYIGFELNSSYIDIANRRIKNQLGLFV